jgi:excinuclease ABC subunit A
MAVSRPFEGIISNLERRFKEQQSEASMSELQSFMAALPCPDCRGDRLSPVVLAVTVGGMNISDYCKLNVTQAKEFIANLKLTPNESKIAESIVHEILSRLDFLQSGGPMSFTG